MVRRLSSSAAPVPVNVPVPQAAPAKSEAAAAPTYGQDQLTRSAKPTSVVVAKGENLSMIAERVLGDPNRWREIFDANRDKLRDPHRLAVGLELRLPGAEADEAPAASNKASKPTKNVQKPELQQVGDVCPFDPTVCDASPVLDAYDRIKQYNAGAEVSYTVRRGDTLSRIAQRELGDSSRWEEILAANGDQLTDASALKPGMVLKMPGDAKGVFKPRATEIDDTTSVKSGHLWDMAREIGKKHNLDPRLIMAVVMKESGGNSRAHSHAGAKGLMQLMPATARGLGVHDPYNPRKNMEGGARYLKQMLNQFGDVKLALMAYNWGPGNVQDYLRGKDRPPAETRAYVPGVLAFYRQFGGHA